MLKLIEKKQCCGCGACKESCPKNAISLITDEEGFLYPEINKEVCIECGICEKVCPFINRYEASPREKKSFAMYTRDEEKRLCSSSGGIFGVIAEEVLANGGIVCGAAYEKDFSISHIAIDKIEDLHKLRGSKYAQSNCSKVFPKIKTALLEGKKVLFSGTACQVAGLKKYLRKEYQNLFTIDVLCHGVPSPKLWKKYIEELEEANKSKLVQFDFRNKSTGWKSYSIKCEYANGLEYSEKYNLNNYMRLFLGNICLRPSCHDCKYKQLDRPSDMTMGDYWGIENQLPELDDDKGTSIVMINSPNGEVLFEKIREKIVFKEVDIEKALPPRADSRKSVRMHPKREKFFKQMDYKSIEQLTKLLNQSFLIRIKRLVKKILKRLRKIL